jgi:hypothetical protein
MSVASHLFAEVSAKLEDLHSISVEGQQPDNASDMHCVLQVQLRSGVAALNDAISAIALVLGGAR